jgi:DNA modification methylase
MGTQQLDIFEEKVQKENYTAESYTGIYGMHKYWSKKPYNIIRTFIQKYSEKGDIVIDPFCGSGISVIESVITNRKAIGFDINPSATFITKQVLNKISVSDLFKAFQKIEKEVKVTINSFYQVKRKENIYQGTHFLWQNNILTEIWYQNGARKKLIDEPTEEDIQFSNSFTYEDIKEYFPKENFYHNSRINAYGNQKIFDLFTPRNLKALALLMNEIEKLEDESIRDILKFCFTSSVGQASKMVFVVKSRGKMNGTAGNERKEVGSWVIGYWTPKENFEINAWNCFENKFNKILKAKRAQEKAPYSIKETEDFVELAYADYNLMLLNQPAQIGLKNLPENSVDYVITDPPHGNRIPYLELSMMWNGWLKKTVDYENEIIISEARERKKDINNYNELLNQVFEEIQRVLKPGKYFSLMFNSLDDQTWTNLVSKLHSLDFELVRVETLEYSANSVVQDTRKAGLKTDFIITFQKQKHSIKQPLEILTLKSDQQIIKAAIKNLYTESEISGFETYQILNHLFRFFLHQNQFFKISEALTLLAEEYHFEKNKWQPKNNSYAPNIPNT